MTYKNGAKTYVLMAVLYGVPMGLFFGIVTLNVIAGIITGVVCGVLFSVLMLAFSKGMEKKYDKMRAELSAERRIVCDGAATIMGNGGWIFLSEYGLEFYPHKVNFSRKEIMLPINQIKDIQVKANRLTVSVPGDTVTVTVVNAPAWKKHISDEIAAYNARLQASYENGYDPYTL